MAIDLIVAEVRQAREELSQRFNYDLGEMIRVARERQEASGRRVVRLPPRPVKNITRSEKPSHQAVTA